MTPSTFTKADPTVSAVATRCGQSPRLDVRLLLALLVASWVPMGVSAQSTTAAGQAQQPQWTALSYPAFQRFRRLFGGLQPAAQPAQRRAEFGGMVIFVRYVNLKVNF